MSEKLKLVESLAIMLPIYTIPVVRLPFDTVPNIFFVDSIFALYLPLCGATES